MSTVLRLLAAAQPTPELRAALESWGLGAYWEPIMRSDAYRRHFRRQLRAALLLKAVVAARPGLVSPLGFLVTKRPTMLGAVLVRPADQVTPLPQPYQGLPYLFVSSTERADSWLLLLLQQERLPVELLQRVLQERLSPEARELLQSGALNDFSSLTPAQIKTAFDEPMTRRRRLYAAFELLGSTPTGVGGDLYDLPSLVEHYCALFGHDLALQDQDRFENTQRIGHTEQQLQYLQSVGKKVYLAQQRHLPQRLKGLAYFYRPVVTDAELRADQRGWLQRLKMYPQMRHDSLSEWPHYFLQAWLDANAARVQLMLEELLLEAGMPDPTAQELLSEVAYRLAYEPGFLRWLSEVYADSQPVVAAVLRQSQWPWVALIGGGYLESVELLLRHMDRDQVPVELLLDTATQAGSDDMLELLLGWLPAGRVLAWLDKIEAIAPASSLDRARLRLRQGRILADAIQQAEFGRTLASS